MERFSLQKLNEVKSKEQYHVEVLNRFTVLEDSDSDLEIDSAMETVRENTNILSKESLGHYELEKHKPWFDEGCSDY
jgi:hypothetical protein